MFHKVSTQKSQIFFLLADFIFTNDNGLIWYLLTLFCGHREGEVEIVNRAEKLSGT